MRTENVLDEFERERTGNHSCQSGTTGCPVGPYQAGVVRTPGTMRGKIRIKKNVDEPLPTELLASFAGNT
jgi:hypothetical protein